MLDCELVIWNGKVLLLRLVVDNVYVNSQSLTNCLSDHAMLMLGNTIFLATFCNCSTTSGG